MLWDFNHVVKIKFHNETKDLELIPTTGTSELVLLHNNCSKCWSMHGAKWEADQPKHSKQLHKKKFEYFYMMHLYDAEVSGHYYKVDACLRGSGSKDACGKEMLVYAVEQAKPYFYTLGEGYLGLAPAHGYNNKVENSVFNQMFSKGMIDKKIMGVHTHNANKTNDWSQIRFGEGNRDFFDDDNKLVYLNTKSKTSWEVKFDSAGFHEDAIWKNQHALIDPGYPFIGMPEKAFDTFKQDLLQAYPDEAVTCSDDEWCYFLTHCDKLKEKMPSLKFTFPVSRSKIQDMDSVTFEIPAESFLFDDTDLRTKLKTCHVGVVRQRFSDLDHFVLGSAFMENFYVIFDGQNEEGNFVALNYQGGVAADSSGHGLAFALAIIVVIGLLGLFAIVATCVCVKRRQAEKLSKAKAYFNSLKTEQEDDPDQLTAEDAEEADRCDAEERLNPNGFISNSKSKLTANEQAIGSLL